MRLLLAALFCLAPLAAFAAEAPQTWLIAVDRWGNRQYESLTFRETAGRIEGKLGATPVAGELRAGRMTFTAEGKDGTVWRYDGKLKDGRLSGSADFPDPNNDKARAVHPFTGRRLPERPAGPARRVTFAPSDYSNLFTADREPVLVIWPGDTLVTQTLDSGGVDHAGATRALFGNPQTGPFFVAGAEPGAILAIHIHRLRLNRDWADSLDGIVPRAMVPQGGDLGKRVRWALDREAGLARLDPAPEGLKDFTVPVRPMLGGLGVAPDFGLPPISTGDTGRFGGNMDYNAIGEGATVYLPVYQPGALLYLGDGHAAQGDGETTQWALETSLDVEFSVEVLSARPQATPRIETPSHIAALGQAGSLDEATRAATAGLVQWLRQDWGLTLSEASLVLGSSVEYRIATLAGRNAGVVARLEKARLPPRRSPG
jgi:amidase